MSGSEAGRRPNPYVLAIEHVREMEAGLDKIQRNLLVRLKALLANLSPEDPMHERLGEVLEALEDSLGTQVPLDRRVAIRGRRPLSRFQRGGTPPGGKGHHEPDEEETSSGDR